MTATAQIRQALEPGDHACLIYAVDEEQVEVLRSFVAAGLQRGERVVVVDADVADPAAQERGQLVLLPSEETYLDGGGFDPERVTRLLLEQLEAARDNGWSGLRWSGGMSWALESGAGAAQLIELEARLAERLPPGACTLLSRYDRRRFPPALLLDVLRAYRVAVIGSEIHDNPFYVSPDRLRGPQRAEAELEQRIGNLEEHSRLVQSLQQSETRFRQLFEQMISGYALYEAVFDAEGHAVDYRYLEVNPAFERLAGMPAAEVNGRTMRELFPEVEPAQLECYARVAEGGGPGVLELEIHGRHLEVIAFRPAAGQLAAMFGDITDRRRAEEERQRDQRQMFESQKLESLGLLAGGIAHDFNNLLVGILGNASLALADLSPLSPVVAYVRDIELSAQRAAALARQLLAYSGRGRFVVEALSIPELVEEMGHLLEASIPRNVVLRYHFRRTGHVMADASQLRQVVMNLIVNGAQAIGEKSGIISIACDVMDCDAEYLATTFGAPELRPGRYVYLEISDTGAGMDAETQTRIFDPFFTTKEHGKGLGLAAVLGIIRGHSGTIKVYSEVGRGSTFKILLPECDEQPQAQPEAAAEAEWSGKGTVLVIDDEEAVRRLASRVLERLGFDVLAAEGGREGLAIYRGHHEEIVLVLLDMMMPHLGGERTFTELRRIDPDVKVVLTSGYNEQDAVNRFVGRGLAGFLQKPYQPKEMVQLVRRLLTPEPDEDG